MISSIIFLVFLILSVFSICIWYTFKPIKPKKIYTPHINNRYKPNSKNVSKSQTEKSKSNNVVKKNEHKINLNSTGEKEFEDLEKRFSGKELQNRGPHSNKKNSRSIKEGSFLDREEKTDLIFGQYPIKNIENDPLFDESQEIVMPEEEEDISGGLF